MVLMMIEELHTIISTNFMSSEALYDTHNG